MSKNSALDKKLVARAFAKSTSTYEKQAVVQKEMGLALLASLRKSSGKTNYSRVLEVGCCTGFLTEQLCREARVDTIFLNDLVSEFCVETAKRVASCTGEAIALSGDIESLKLPKDLDLILSSATLQWLGNLPLLLENFGRALKPGGLLAVSIFGPGTMGEIHKLTGRGLAYLPEAQLLNLVQENYLLLASEQLHRVLFFDTVQEVLKHIRATGVGGVSQHRWTKSSLQQFARDYQQQFKRPQGLPVSYRATTFIGKTADAGK